MPCPQPPKLLVLQRQLANQRGELHIVGALADIHPQNADDCRSHAGRFGEPIARFRREEDLPGHVPLPGRQSGTVPEDNGGEPVPSEDVPAPADEEGGHAKGAAGVLGRGLK
jgi:hypothetical protein